MMMSVGVMSFGDYFLVLVHSLSSSFSLVNSERNVYPCIFEVQAIDEREK